MLQPAVRRSVCGDLHMGKGKSAGGPNIAMRGELKKRGEMERMREQVVTDHEIFYELLVLEPFLH